MKGDIYFFDRNNIKKKSFNKNYYCTTVKSSGMKKKTSSSTQKKNTASSSSNSSTRAQKHQTTESVGDDLNDDVLNEAIASTSPTTSESNELSNKLRLCYDRLLQLEKNANEYNESGNKAEADEFLRKAKDARKEIESLLREVNNAKKKQNLLVQKPQSPTSVGNVSTRTTSVSFVANIAPVVVDKKREELISKMIETNFSDPTPELVAECKAKGLDLNKKRYVMYIFSFPNIFSILCVSILIFF